ncbi:MAG: hypothetical protein ACREHD_27355, partial [Pirellulales bacterium]
PMDYRKLLAPLIAEDADVVYGSRYLGDVRSFKGRRRLDLGVTVLNLAVWLIYHERMSDEATCYKAFRTTTLRAMELTAQRFDFCAEVTAKACRMRLRFKEVPIAYSPRTRGEGKKLRMSDGIEALRMLWKLRHWRRGLPFSGHTEGDDKCAQSRRVDDARARRNPR